MLAGRYESGVAFAFTPRQGRERLLGPVKVVAHYRSDLHDRFGCWIEGVPVRTKRETFTATGRIIERDRFEADGRLRYKAVYDYDDSGRMSMRTHYDGSGRPVLRYFYDYDGEARLAALQSFTPEGSRVSRLSRRYRPDGILASLVEETAEGETLWSLTVDGHGGITAAEGTRTQGGRMVERILCRYDSNGALMGRERFDARGGLLESQRYSYEALERGNWTRCLTHCLRERFGREAFEPEAVTLRRFAFHRG